MNKKAGLYIIGLICVFFAAFGHFFSPEWNKWGLYIALPLACVMTFIINGGAIFVNNHVTRLWGLLLWVVISVPFAKYTDLAIREFHQILGVVLITYIFGGLSKNEKIVPWLYCTYLVLYFSAWYYAQNNIIDDISFGEDRLDDAKLNANMLAYYTFYVTFVIFFLGEIVKSLVVRKFFRYAFFLTIPLSFWVAMFTASRQVFVIQIPLIAVLLYWRYLKKAKAIYQVLFVVAFVIGFIVLFPMVQSQYEGSLLQIRNSRNIENDVRIKLMIDSFLVGISHFFTGVGAGNYPAYSFDGHFSHNTFLELFANNGIIGLVLIVRIYYLFLRDQFTRYKQYRDTNYLYFFIFGVFFLIDSMFYVFYSKIWLMGFFMLVASHSDTYFKNRGSVIASNEKNSDSFRG